MFYLVHVRQQVVQVSIDVIIIPAKALRAAAVFFKTALVSKSNSKGSCGILYAIV